MESTSSRESLQKLGEDGNILIGGAQLDDGTSTAFSRETNAANNVQECAPCLASSSSESNLRRPLIKNVVEYKIFKLHEINELEASGSSEVSGDYVLDLSTSATRFRLQEHSLNDQIDSEPKLFECGRSDQRRNSQDSLNANMRYEEILKPKESDHCEKRFHTKTRLMQHQRVRTREKKHECKTCKKTFRYPYDLFRHERIHTGEKPFKCELCKKSFNQKSSLKRHVFTHTGERPFECEICHKQFTRMHHLTRHGRVHKRERPYY